MGRNGGVTEATLADRPASRVISIQNLQNLVFFELLLDWDVETKKVVENWLIKFIG